MFGNAELRSLRFLIYNPGWHFPLDLVRAGATTRWSVITTLCKLEDYGMVERREEPPPTAPGSLYVMPPRHQFRARLAPRQPMDDGT